MTKHSDYTKKLLPPSINLSYDIQEKITTPLMTNN